MEIKSLKEDKNMTDHYPNWFDRNKLKKNQVLLTATNLITRIKQVTSSILTLNTWLIILEIIQLVKYVPKKGLNALSEIKNAGIIKYKKCTPKQKELLNLFNDLLDAIITDKTLKSKSQKDKILMSSKDENEKEKEKEVKMKMKMTKR